MLKGRGVWLSNTLCGCTRCSLSIVSRRRAFFSFSDSKPSPRQAHFSTHSSVCLSQPNLLNSTKVETFLQEVAATKHAVSLSDIERYRRPLPSFAVGTEEFEMEYNALVSTLLRSFSKSQLLEFCHLYNIGALPRKSKRACAEAIIERQWGWPALSHSVQLRRDLDETEKTFLLTLTQAFLVLGKDGSDLLSLSDEFNVRLTLSTSPIALKVEGQRGSVKRLGEQLKAIQQDITHKSVDCLTNQRLSSKLLQRISRLSGAFVQERQNNQVLISYKNSNLEALFLAQRLLVAATSETYKQSRVSFLAHVPPVTQLPTLPTGANATSYSLFPFVSPWGIPWSVDPMGLSRIRLVGDSEKHHTGTTYEAGDVCFERGLFVNIDRHAISLNDEIANLLSYSSQGDQHVLTASPGHVLIASGDPSSSMNQPLKGNRKLDDHLAWIKENPACIRFVPGAPHFLLASRPQKQQFIQRLVYHSPVMQNLDSPQAVQVLKFEVSVPTHGLIGAKRDHPLPEPLCSVGTELTKNLLLPHRPTDLQLTAFHGNKIAATSVPEELRDYARSLSYCIPSPTSSGIPSSDIPLVLQVNGVEYFFTSSCNVRQSQEMVKTIFSNFPQEVILERIVELDSSRRATACIMQLEAVEWETARAHFLAACDALTLDVTKI